MNTHEFESQGHWPYCARRDPNSLGRCSLPASADVHMPASPATEDRATPTMYCSDCVQEFRDMDVKLCPFHASAKKRIEALEAALKQSRTLISTLKHVDDLDRMSLNAAVDLTLYKINAALKEDS